MVKQSLCDPTPLDAAKAAPAVLARADLLAGCSDLPDGIMRLFCSPAMAAAHRLVRGWMEEAGMTTRVDAAGNLVGRYGPSEGRSLLIGSHLDTVANAGRYDGVLGVLMGLATVESLRRRATPLPWAIEVVAFSDEEGVRFGVPYLGSRALAGDFSPLLLELTDEQGTRLDDALRAFGCDPGEIPRAAVDAQQVVAYLEPHLEQTRALELSDVPLAVVTTIVGQSRVLLDWHGPGGHAGGVPMCQRADPLVAAARWMAQADDLARQTPGATATFGRVEVEPSVSNCIPRRTLTSLDVRHADDATRRDLLDQLLNRAGDLAAESGVQVRIEQQLDQRATPLDEGLNQRFLQAAREAGHPMERVVCGAGHDAAVMAGRVASSMLLIRSPGGVSHAPEEHVLPDDVAAGLQTMDLFIRALATRDHQGLDATEQKS